MSTTPQVVVLGVGNLLMSDEGLGVHAIGMLEQGFEFPENVRLVDGGTSTQELLGDLESLDHLLIIDAVDAGKEPGAMIRVENEDVPASFTTKLSPHQVGISDLLAMLKFKGCEPRRVVLFGIEPEVLKLGMDLSPKVAARVPEVVGQVVDELAKLGFAPRKLEGGRGAAHA